MKRQFNYIVISLLVTSIFLLAQSKSPLELSGSTVFVETTKGFIDVAQFEEVARQHLNNSDPTFTNVVNISAYVVPKTPLEISFIYSQELGGLKWTICLDSEMKILKVKKNRGVDKVLRSFPQSPAVVIGKSICD